MTALVIADRVKETSTTTGTGAFTTSGAVTGFRALSAVCSVGDTLYYCIQAVDASNIPTAEWEVGLGTYSASNTLTRTTVLASSNAGSAVNFSAGGKQVSNVFPAAQAKWAKELLTADRTYYVRSDGSNSNSGLANTSGAAFLTIQYALDFVAKNIDANGYIVTLSLADATYAENVVMRYIDGASELRIVGTSTSSTIVSPASGNAFTSNLSNNRTVLVLRTMKLVTSNAYSIRAENNAIVKTNNLNFGDTGYVISAIAGGSVQHEASGPTSTYTISGGGFYFFFCTSGGYIVYGGSIAWTVSTPVTYTTFAYSLRGGHIYSYSNTFTGSAVTAKRYDASINSIIATEAGGANYFPGNVAGSTATGSQYA